MPDARDSKQQTKRSPVASNPPPQTKLIPGSPPAAFCQALMDSQIDVLVRRFLPRCNSDQLSDKSLHQMESTFLGSGLDTGRCDRLYEAIKKDGSKALILIEHKSSHDPGTPLQLMRYCQHIWERYDKDDYPEIWPLVFYHGAPRWTLPQTIPTAEGASSEGIGIRMTYLTCDFGRCDPAMWQGEPVAEAGVTLLGHSSRQPLPDVVLDRVLVCLDPEEVIGRQARLYILQETSVTLESFEKAMRRVRPETAEEEMQTIREVWRAEDETRAKADTLLLQMNQRFGELPAEVQSQVEDASVASLDEWLRAFVDADSIDAVFNGNGRHR